MVEVFAALSLSAAAGIRIALPLLLMGLLYGETLWQATPLLSWLPLSVVTGLLCSGALVEIVWSKVRMGQRFLQIIQLWCSPVVGSMVAVAMARTTHLSASMGWMLAIVGGTLAVVFQLVQVSWAYRLRSLPLWMIFAQDFCCILLSILSLMAPVPGGLLVMILLWMAIRSSARWRRWYLRRTQSTLQSSQSTSPASSQPNPQSHPPQSHPKPKPQSLDS